MVKAADRIFKPVKFESGQVHIAGGFTTTTTPARAWPNTIEGSEATHFRETGNIGMPVDAVHLRGKVDQRGSAFGRTPLLEQLRTCLGRKADGVGDIDDENWPGESRKLNISAPAILGN